MIIPHDIDVDYISEFNFDSILENISSTFIYDSDYETNSKKMIDHITSKFKDKGIEGYIFTKNKSKYGKYEVDEFDVIKYKESQLDYLLNIKNDILCQINKSKKENKKMLTQYMIFDNCFSYDNVDGTIKDLIEYNDTYMFHVIFISSNNLILPPYIRFNLDYVFIYNSINNDDSILYSWWANNLLDEKTFSDTLHHMRTNNSYLVIIKNSLRYYGTDIYDKIFYYNFSDNSNEIIDRSEFIKKCLNGEYILTVDI
jgi:hypothetical protein